MSSICLVADCLKSYEKYREINIMMRLGPTLLGEKPMHIFCFKKDFKFLNELLEDIKMLFNNHPYIGYHFVYSNNDSIKIVIFNNLSMQSLLNNKRITKFLEMRGYNRNLTIKDYMSNLCDNLMENKLPKEYGVFFGYPLKDVIGFIGHPSLKHSKTDGWRMYGDTTESDMILQKFKSAEKQVLELCQSLPIHSVIAQLDSKI